MTRVAINGFGRIGRVAARLWMNDPAGIEIVAVNDLAPIEQMAHLLEFDSIHGRLASPVKAGGGEIVAGGRRFRYTSVPEPEKLPWKELGVDIVLECTGRLLKTELAKKHLDAGARRVILSAPPKSPEIRTFAYKVNHETYDPKTDLVISNASCTTNCLAPMAMVLDSAFDITAGLMVTVHSYTNDQNIHDAPHKKDLRRARGAALSMIPTTTGAAKAVGLVLPHLKGRLSGYAVRVPTPDVSLTDLTVQVSRKADRDAVNEAMRKAAEGSLRGVLEYEDRPLVSVDFTGNPASCIFDSRLTQTMGDGLVKVVGWYDNETGYSARMLDLARYVGGRL
ncbi:MAG: type I glyceraldehyde-3-phosphate dehydrogenase [Deltaproteobacteria bacterium]|nr:type I glyceraldehyde-3-phosphate dehydrogenase [Deltaproteobacteria bacterium]